MVEIFTQAPLELRILIGATLICGAWSMVSEYRAEQKRKERHQHELSKAYKKAKLKLVKK